MKKLGDLVFIVEVKEGKQWNCTELPVRAYTTYAAAKIEASNYEYVFRHLNSKTRIVAYERGRVL